MGEIVVHLVAQDDGSVRVTGTGEGAPWAHVAPAAGVTAAHRLTERVVKAFEDGGVRSVDPVFLAESGRLLAETFLAPLYAGGIAAGGRWRCCSRAATWAGPTARG